MDMGYARRSPVTRVLVESLCLLGGVLGIVGYFLPWATYHLEGGYLTTTTNGWLALFSDGGGSIFAFNSGAVRLLSLLGAAVVLLYPFPFLMAALALYSGIRLSAPAPSAWSRFVRRIYWPVTAGGILELLLLTHALIDPLGLNAQRMWLISGDPPPTVGPGLYIVYVGAFAVLLGGLLPNRWRGAHAVAD